VIDSDRPLREKLEIMSKNFDELKVAVPRVRSAFWDTLCKAIVQNDEKVLNHVCGILLIGLSWMRLVAVYQAARRAVA